MPQNTMELAVPATDDARDKVEPADGHRDSTNDANYRERWVESRSLDLRDRR